MTTATPMTAKRRVRIGNLRLDGPRLYQRPFSSRQDTPGRTLKVKGQKSKVKSEKWKEAFLVLPFVF
jgi:hypothetical protein